jgi:hypothetical protein
LSTEKTTLETTTEDDEAQYVSVAELDNFLGQINATLMGIVAGINKTITDMNNNRSKNSDDNKD